MVQGPATRKIHFFIDDKDDHDKGLHVSGTDPKRIKLMGSLEEIGAENVSRNSGLLGLTLKKTPSFLDLIEMELNRRRNLKQNDEDSDKSEEVSAHTITENSTAASEEILAQRNTEKHKAANFPANLLRIGTWERVTVYEGDLVSKCYYAKRKLVWEVLDRGLKSKIEIQWSDISAIRATFQKNKADILEIELCRAPMFFRETNPQPRKHTLWQTSSDFTGGQAPIYRRHHVQFPEGTLERHFEKLLKCDNRLMMLSKKPFPTLNSPYFHSNLYGYPDFSFGYNGLQLFPQTPHFSVTRPNAMLLHQLQNFNTITPSFTVTDSTSPMSVMDFPLIKENGISYNGQQHQRAPAVWPQGISNDQNFYSRKRSETGELPLMMHPRQDTSLIPQQEVYHRHMPCGGQYSNNLSLNEIAEQLLNDPFALASSDEQRVLAKVRSMGNLLDHSKESIPTSGNANTSQANFNFSGNQNMVSNMEQSIRGSESLCPQPLDRFATQGSNENPSMNFATCPSFSYFIADPAMEDSSSVDCSGNEINQWL